MGLISITNQNIPHVSAFEPWVSCPDSPNTSGHVGPRMKGGQSLSPHAVFGYIHVGHGSLINTRE